MTKKCKSCIPIVFVLLWTTFGTVVYAADDALGEHARDIIKVYGAIIIGQITLIGALVVYIFKSSISALRELVKSELDGMGTRVSNNDRRISHMEGEQDAIFKMLRKEYLTKEQHDAVCVGRKRKGE